MIASEVKNVVLPRVIVSKTDLSFNGEELAGASSKKDGDLNWTTIQVYRVHPHNNKRHPSNRHAGRFIIVIINKSGLHDVEDKITYIHCADANEVIEKLRQPWRDGSKTHTNLSNKVLTELALNEPHNFKK